MFDSKNLTPHIQKIITNSLQNHISEEHYHLDGVTIRARHIYISLIITPQMIDVFEKYSKDIENNIKTQLSLQQATLSFTAPRKNDSNAQQPHRPLSLPSPLSQKGKTAATRLAPKEGYLPQVKAVIAIASGKGGVGKSTTALNLACALSQKGLKIGILDADIHGPSLPHMLGIHKKPEVKDGKLLPMKAWGMETMSIGYLVDEKQAMIWRGPMVMGALIQFIGDVLWGTLDYLIIDMPPGTGDAQLTLTQKLGHKLSKGGAIIVSTPQDIALLDARRGVTLFEKTQTPLLGLIENMSYFCCPHCQEKTEIFGHNGAKQEASKLSIAFLGAVPLLPQIRLTADQGTPILLQDPQHEASIAYQKICDNLLKQLHK